MGATVSYLLMLEKYISSKQKILNLKKSPLCLGNISGYFLANNMKKPGLNGNVYDFSLDYNVIDTNNFIDIHIYFIKKTSYKIMLGLIKKYLWDY